MSVEAAVKLGKRDGHDGGPAMGAGKRKIGLAHLVDEPSHLLLIQTVSRHDRAQAGHEGGRPFPGGVQTVGALDPGGILGG